ncbi:MAG: hypothetical protein OEV49_03480 [candidate division Zixibacteria bacterium]|nr:hypothetical protein [candidate division Zixibacteria bacterium]MDH3939245.1 hypothetical protein [candidate division Zixibacteria bacterium]MDH4034647.1 hypothetical protein [candidate division Zixibacteria bacterium]
MRMPKSVWRALGIIFTLQLGVAASAQNVELDWTRQYPVYNGALDWARALALDADGNLYVTGVVAGASSDDLATVKYSPTGHRFWIADYDGPGGDDDDVVDIEVGPSGNVFILCTVSGVEHSADYATIKYSPDGDTVWTRLLNLPTNYQNHASDLAVDALGNAYVTGHIGQNDGFLTAKYLPNGDTAWARIYSPGGLNGREAIAVDASGAVYVVGEQITIKYDADGTLLWSRTPGGSCIVLDNAQSVIVCGTGIAKLYPNGDTAWVNPSLGTAIPNIGVDSEDNLIIAGGAPEEPDHDFRTVKISGSGDTLWIRYYKSPEHSMDILRDMALDSDGGIYITGYDGEQNYGDFLTIKYDRDGNERWTQRYDGPESDTDLSEAIVVDNTGAVYVTGLSVYPSASYTSDFITLKYLQDYCCTGIAGNIDDDPADQMDIADLVYLVDFMFSGGPEPDCYDEADVDGSMGLLDIADLVYVVDYMFTGGPEPVACPY